MALNADVMVVGGGPAGLATAIACRARGLRVAVLDGATPPIDKGCGEGLLPDSLAALARLGVRLEEGQGFGFGGIRFCAGSAKVDASFPDGNGVGVRRTLLHELLCERAEAVGVTFRWATRVSGLADLQCRWVVGADGEHSRVRRWAGLDAHRRESRRFGFRRHYRMAPWTDCVEIHWGAGCQIYVTPVARDEVGVALISRDAGLRLDRALEGFPEQRERLQGAALASVERGAVTATRRLLRVTKGNVALVGDASGSVDAITAEGLCVSFSQALSLAEALQRGRLEEYDAEHVRIMRRPRLMGSSMMLLGECSWLRALVLRSFEARPGMFAKMLALHVGAKSKTGNEFAGAPYNLRSQTLR